MTKSLFCKFDRFYAPLATLALSIFLIWSAVQWFHRDRHLDLFDRSKFEERQKRALKRLKLIRKAQEKYITADWDQDGKKEYARFLTQLWQCPDFSTSKPVRVNLISRELAFSMESSFALDGYSFSVLRYKKVKNREKTPIDFSKEWAVTAVPVHVKYTNGKEGKSARESYIFNSKGELYSSRDLVEKIDYLPSDFKASGWLEIKE